MQPKPSSDRRRRDQHESLPIGQYHGRTLSARRYLELGRQPRLSDLPQQPFPYLAAAATAASFLFLLYLILGGA